MFNNFDGFYLVTGACGFVGSHMVEFLIRKGLPVVATDIVSCPNIIDISKTPFIKADLTKKSDIRRIFKKFRISKIFHIAAIFSYSAPWNLLFRVNVGGTKNLCEVSLNYDVDRIIVWSSGSVYGIPDKIPVSEDHPLRPINDYERSKAFQEIVALRYYRENGLPVTIIRPAAIYGPRSKYGVALPILLLAKSGTFFIPGRGDIKPALVHVSDVVSAAYFLAENPKAVGEVYNVCDDSSYTVRELIFAASKFVNGLFLNISVPLPILYSLAAISLAYSKIVKDKPLIELNALRYLTYDSLMDNSKLKSLGYKLIYPDTLVGLFQTIKWFKKEGLI